MFLLWCRFYHLKNKFLTGSHNVTFKVRVDAIDKLMCIGVMHPWESLDRAEGSSSVSHCSLYCSDGHIYINSNRVTALTFPGITFFYFFTD
jgi:hypothetical protein